MKTYKIRFNHFIEFNKQNSIITGKLAIKTSETEWVNTSLPVLFPLSIDSAFHQGIAGEMKMEAFINVIRKNIASTLTILVTEKAHLNVLTLKENNPIESCMKKAQDLHRRFHKLFGGCKISFWGEYIQRDPSYLICQEKVMKIYQMDETFRNLLIEDAISTYTPQREIEYPDRSLYLEKTILDILEQGVCLWVLAEKGYKYQFYPGRQYSSIMYLNQFTQLNLIDVFVTIEKKRTQKIVT